MPKSPPKQSVFVGNLPQPMTPEQLRQTFESHLPQIRITQVNIHRDKRFGFVVFESEAAATEAAAAMNGFSLGDRKIRVEVTQHEPQRGAPAQ